MATVNFFLKTPKSVQPSAIQLHFFTKSFRFKFYVGESISPNKWNFETKRAKKSADGFLELNQYLDSLDAEVKKFQRVCLSTSQTFNEETLKNHLTEFTGKNSNNKNNGFFKCLEEYIKVKEGKFSYNYLKTVKTMKNHLLAFEDSARLKLDFDKVNMKFYELFTSYLFKKELTNNTVGLNISRLKRFLEWATQMGYNSNMYFKEKGFKAMESETEIIALTENELFQLYHFDFSKNKRLLNVRESFCFGCFTGLRFSDIAKIKKEDVRSDELFLRIQKTKDPLVIPLSIYAKEILIRNNFDLAIISNQKTNNYLKEICKIVDFSTPIKITRFRGSERVEIVKPKYECVSSHTARRTFVTLSLEKGLRPEVVMAISGHKSYKNFKKYIQLTDKVKKSELQRVWGELNYSE